ncbi:MAG TPA: phosphopentomutase [Bacteroidetes bacterium]|nr:phosphopentomutase [Bacteroidota bacterium]
MGSAKVKRVILIVLDSVGVGHAPDADVYGDKGSNTIGNIVKNVNGFKLPNMCSLGLHKLVDIESNEEVIGSYGKAIEVSSGKDTTSGHWEIAGLYIDKPFPTFPNGFPKQIIDQFEEAIGSRTLGNFAASGTQIINQLGDGHVSSGCPIVYTSADSVFQIAAHEEVIPIDRLYDICEKAREILTGPYAVGRVIARPFKGNTGKYERTLNRKDFSLIPNGETVLSIAKNAGLEVRAVGKISDIYSEQGITSTYPAKTNAKGIDQTIELIKEDFSGLIMTNLVDFDTMYGHRRDVEGYAEALRYFDKRLPEIISVLNDDDILIITADHGNDPTFKGTDHTREMIPILIYGNKIKKGADIGVRNTFADIGTSICSLLDLPSTQYGNSFSDQIINMAYA